MFQCFKIVLGKKTHLFSFVMLLPMIALFLQCKSLQWLEQPEQQPERTQLGVSKTIEVNASLVRLIYFTPKDRPFKERITDQMVTHMHIVQTFYADQMENHGYGRKAFAFETDAKGEMVTHQVKGQFTDTHYLYNTTKKVWTEIQEQFDVSKNIFVVIVDISSSSIRGALGHGSSLLGGRSGILWISKSGMQSQVIAHELGHAFGLQHDFRNNQFLMSYGSYNPSSTQLRRTVLSNESAEFLDVSRFFNSNRTFSSHGPPQIKITSSLEYPPGSDKIHVRFELFDLDGLHQARFHTNPNITDKDFLAKFSRGSPSFKASKKLNGSNISVEFIYRLSKIDVHQLWLQVIDSQGHFNMESFSVSAQD